VHQLGRCGHRPNRRRQRGQVPGAGEVRGRQLAPCDPVPDRAVVRPGPQGCRLGHAGHGGVQRAAGGDDVVPAAGQRPAGLIGRGGPAGHHQRPVAGPQRRRHPKVATAGQLGEQPAAPGQHARLSVQGFEHRAADPPTCALAAGQRDRRPAQSEGVLHLGRRDRPGIGIAHRLTIWLTSPVSRYSRPDTAGSTRQPAQRGSRLNAATGSTRQPAQRGNRLNAATGSMVSRRCARAGIRRRGRP